MIQGQLQEVLVQGMLLLKKILPTSRNQQVHPTNKIRKQDDQYQDLIYSRLQITLKTIFPQGLLRVWLLRVSVLVNNVTIVFLILYFFSTEAKTQRPAPIAAAASSSASHIGRLNTTPTKKAHTVDRERISSMLHYPTCYQSSTTNVLI